MKLGRHHIFSAIFLSVIALLVLFCSDSFAAEEAGKGRKIWDNFMLWVNFGILVFFFIKFGKKPLINFLNGERNKVEKTISTVDMQLKEGRSLMETEADKIKSIDAYLKRLHDDILEIGEKEKNQIISKAKDAAAKMIEDAQKESDYMLVAAKNSFSEEMLDMAITITIDRLNKVLSFEDDKKIIEQFAEGVNSVNSSLV